MKGRCTCVYNCPTLTYIVVMASQPQQEQENSEAKKGCLLMVAIALAIGLVVWVCSLFPDGTANTWEKQQELLEYCVEQVYGDSLRAKQLKATFREIKDDRSSIRISFAADCIESGLIPPSW